MTAYATSAPPLRASSMLWIAHGALNMFPANNSARMLVFYSGSPKKTCRDRCTSFDRTAQSLVVLQLSQKSSSSQKLHSGSYAVFSIPVKPDASTSGWLAIATGCSDVEAPVMPFPRKGHMNLVSNSIPSGSDKESLSRNPCHK